MAKTAQKEKTNETKGGKPRSTVLKKAVIPRLTPGDSVKVTSRIIEGDKERTQLFQGVIIKIKKEPPTATSLCAAAYGVGVERTFPLASPMVAKVEVVRHGARSPRTSLLFAT
jgi:ribosomal protein L19